MSTQRKPEFIEEEVRLINRDLSRKGLCIFVSVENVKDGKEM